MTPDSAVRALTTPVLLRLVGIPASTLNYWVARGFVHPTLDAGSGRRATRYWTVEDVVVLRSIKELRSQGCSLQVVARVEGKLREQLATGLGEAVLYYDGSDVMVDEQGRLISLLAEVGQGVFPEAVHLSAFSLHPWIEEADRHCEVVDLKEIRARRAAAKARRTRLTG